VILGSAGELLGYGKVTHAYVVPMDSVPNEWLADFHDGTVSNRHELAEYLKKVYGEAAIEERRQVVKDTIARTPNQTIYEATVTVIAFTFQPKAESNNG
jgi:hypothetical protein